MWRNIHCPLVCRRCDGCIVQAHLERDRADRVQECGKQLSVLAISEQRPVFVPGAVMNEHMGLQEETRVLTLDGACPVSTRKRLVP